MANLKSREFEAILKQYGVENGVVRIMTHLLERINDLEAAQTVQGQLLDRMSDIVSSFATIAENMKHTIDDMKPQEASQ